MNIFEKRTPASKMKIILTIEPPLHDCNKILKKIEYDERFLLIDFPLILEHELSKETKLSRLIQ